MERADKRKKSTFRKEGGGSFRIGNRIIKPGQKFKEYPENIPQIFRDTIILVDGDDVGDIEEKKIEVDKPVYTYKKRETGNWYDIFDANDKKVSEKALTRQQALDYIKGLE